MKVAIVGSRYFPQLWMVRDYVNDLEDGTIVISGGAVGVDKTAMEEARRRGFLAVEIKPDYEKHGRLAPLNRNLTIAETCDRMVAFWDGKSHGTAHVVRLAKQLGKPVVILTAREGGGT